MSFIAATIVGFLSGILASMGLGGGFVLVVYFAIFTDFVQKGAQGINLLFFIPTALLAVIIYSIKRKIKWKLTAKIAVWGLIGAALGLSLTSLLGGEITSKIFGGLLILMGVSEIFKRDTKTVAEKKKR